MLRWISMYVYEKNIKFQLSYIQISYVMHPCITLLLFIIITINSTFVSYTYNNILDEMMIQRNLFQKLS